LVKKQSVKRLESLCAALHRINIGYLKMLCVLHLTYYGESKEKELMPIIVLSGWDI
jgi:hypothetical protein